MKTPQIAALTSEGCTDSTGHKVCRSRGGESCAFDGAMIVLQPIADAAHLVHGPITCAGNSWEGRGTVSDKGTLHRRGFTTDMRELDIVYGSDRKLFKAIMETRDRVAPKAIFVYSTCLSGLIGEDINAVCEKASKELDIPVIAVNAPGFVGPKNLGNRIAGEVLLEHVIGRGEPDVLTGAEINILGEYNIAGDLQHVEDILQQAGIRVLSRITGNASFGEIMHAHRARLNVLVCGRALVNVASAMNSRYGIAYVEGSFFGSTGMSRTLRRIAEALGNDNIRSAIEQTVASREKDLRTRLRPYSYFHGMKAVLYSGGVKSWAMIEALQDLGFEVSAVGVKKSTAEDERKVRELLPSHVPVVDNVTPARLLSLMRETGADLMVAGGRNMYLGVKEGFPFVDVNQERHSAYAGYEGLINLAEDIHKGMLFYGRVPGRIPEPPVLRVDTRALLLDPLKHSQSLGAVLALQGVDKAFNVWHGAQGCNFLGKVLLTKHFREPVSVVSSKLFAEDIVMSGPEKAISTAIEGAQKHSPELVCVISSALSEVKGDDMAPVAREVRESTGAEAICIQSPDHEGDMETGYVAAVEALCQLAVRPSSPVGVSYANVLIGPDLTPADCLAIKGMVESFGLYPIILPDLSALDGTREHVTALTSGGTTLNEIRLMGSASITIAIGACMEPAAQLLYKRFGMQWLYLDGLDGIEACDRFMSSMSAQTGMPVAEKYLRQRQVLRDAMRDAYPWLSGKRACMALNTSQALRLSMLLDEAGMDIPLCVVPELKPYAGRIRAKEVLAGGISAAEGMFDLMVSNSHAVDRAGQLGVPLYQAGFPSYKTFGQPLKTTVGYEGSLNTIIDLVNILMEVH